MTTTTLSPPQTGTPRTPRVAYAIVALALGGFAIGTTEFVTMGLLPDIASGIDESIPSTGHIISAYALGVFIGAPLIVSVAATLPRKALAIGLVLALGVGNLLTALAQSYPMLMAARFVAGLPHGAYFGVASLIAASLVPADKRGRAVSSVMLGLAVANVAGVPAATWLGQTLGWRTAYVAVVVITIATALLVLAYVPHSPRDRGARIRTELSALRRPQVWLTLAIGTVGFGGMFAMYSYIAPVVTDVAHQGKSFIPAVLFAFGLGGIAGTALGGRLADWAILRSLMGALVATGVLLAVFTQVASHAPALVATVFLVSMTASTLVVCLQMRLMEVAGHAAMLGAALNHSSLNAANALGAWLGGVVITSGYGYTAPSAVGAVLAVAGLAILATSGLLYRNERLAISLSH
ncbi:MFS transporter [Solicola gregarius]|uniref:MFS transporter n=1 Tax=Solicola gregarius TaxID=2908642 RepID=A0AA46YKF0_9ACTN|nr:MFS transporter [Solicola gregarius]UYM03913.1 MFS transporter [Solicola gregarius]